MAFSDTKNNLLNSIRGGRRLLLIVGVTIAVVLLIYFFGIGGPPTPNSEIRTTTVQPTTQGQVPVTPAMDKELSTADQKRTEQALQSNQSSMPTIRVAPAANMGPSLEDPNKPKDLGTLNRPIPPIIQSPVVQATPLPTSPPIVPVTQKPVQPDPIDSALVASMRAQMDQMMKMQFVEADVKFYNKDFANRPVAAAPSIQQSAPAGSPRAANQLGGISLPMPGSIVYAEMISSANSDSPGPVVARIIQGEFAGATLLGSFALQRDALVISFNSMTMDRTRDGTEVNKTIPIQAVAVDSKTVSPGMATSVDRHMFNNLAFTAAAAFAQGLGQAIQSSGATVTQGIGLSVIANPVTTTKQQLMVAGGTAAAAAGQAFNQAYGNRPTTVKVDAGTPFGVLFLNQGN